MRKKLNFNKEEADTITTELEEIGVNIEKLDAFIKKALNGDVEDISKADIELLREQLHYMNGYLRVLKIRIQRVFEAHK